MTPNMPHVTADDVEIWDVMNREGSDAAVKRAAELERNRRRRERRAKREHYELLARNRNIQFAAQKLVADQQRQAQGTAQAPATSSQPPANKSVSAPAVNVQTATASAAGTDPGRKPPQSDAAEAQKVSEGTA